MRRRTSVKDDTGVAAARSRFGGFDLPAALAGMLAALGLAVLLAGIAGAAGTIGYQRGTSAEDLSSGGLITGMAVLLVAFFVGGWVAGRMSRYDGVLNGLLAALLFVGLAGAMSAVGNWLDDTYDFFSDVRLPQWFSGADTDAALGTAALGIVVMVVAAALGGARGGRYHRRADAVIVDRPAVVETEPAVVETETGPAAVEGDEGNKGDEVVDLDQDRADHSGRHAVR